MGDATYTYQIDIPTYFPNNHIDSNMLQTIICDDSYVNCKIQYIDTDMTNLECFIHFAGPLSDAEQTRVIEVLIPLHNTQYDIVHTEAISSKCMMVAQSTNITISDNQWQEYHTMLSDCSMEGNHTFTYIKYAASIVSNCSSFTIRLYDLTNDTTLYEESCTNATDGTIITSAYNTILTPPADSIITIDIKATRIDTGIAGIIKVRNLTLFSK